MLLYLEVLVAVPSTWCNSLLSGNMATGWVVPQIYITHRLAHSARPMPHCHQHKFLVFLRCKFILQHIFSSGRLRLG